MLKRQQVCMLVALAAWLLPCLSHAGQEFRVATYNLQNYFLQPTDRRPAKSPEARAKIRHNLRALRADVVALQEVGGPAARLELQASLKIDGLNYPYCDAISGADTNTQQVILSKFPILARRPHTDGSFVLFDRRFSVQRGFAEVDIQVNTNYVFTLIAAHLKSRLPTPEADEADLREAEALLLRNIVSERLKANPAANLLVLGDLNDHRSSRTLRTLLGRGPARLIDTEPGEHTGHPVPVSPKVSWTYFYPSTETYSRVDYILLSPGMARGWQKNGSYVFASPDWTVASDHRPVVASFMVPE